MIIDKLPPAPGDTLLGRLQRGTGAGYLEALAADPDVARNALRAAIGLDWRWDTQLDSRSWYYACLADSLGISSGDVEQLILATSEHDPGDRADRVAVHVLRQFASWGDDSAVERLIDYVRYGGNPDIPVEWCMSEGSAADLDRLHRALNARFPHRSAVAKDMADRSELVFWLQKLGQRDERFARFVRLMAQVEDARGERSAPTPPPVADLFTDGITFPDGCRAFLTVPCPAALGPTASTRWRQDALAWLAGRFAPEHATWLTEFLLAVHADDTRARIRDLAAILPPEEWDAFVRRALAEGRDGPRSAAEGVLQETTRPDPALVRWCLHDALAAHDMFCVFAMLDIVKRDRLVDLVPDVELVCRDAISSFGGRRRAVETLVALAPQLFRERHARECLWDCEEEIIEIGCRHVDVDDLDVRPRLEFLRDAFADDPDEGSASLHRLARERLGY